MRKNGFIRSLAMESEMPFVFLGGTCSVSDWRQYLIAKLKVKFFNPVVGEWSPEMVELEENAKRDASILLYVFTPEQTGLYGPVELAVSALTTINKKVLYAFIDKETDEGIGLPCFTDEQKLSNEAIKNLLSKHCDSTCLTNMDEIASYLNNYL